MSFIQIDTRVGLALKSDKPVVIIGLPKTVFGEGVHKLVQNGKVALVTASAGSLPANAGLILFGNGVSKKVMLKFKSLNSYNHQLTASKIESMLLARPDRQRASEKRAVPTPSRHKKAVALTQPLPVPAKTSPGPVVLGGEGGQESVQPAKEHPALRKPDLAHLLEERRIIDAMIALHEQFAALEQELAKLKLTLIK